VLEDVVGVDDVEVAAPVGVALEEVVGADVTGEHMLGRARRLEVEAEVLEPRVEERAVAPVEVRVDVEVAVDTQQVIEPTVARSHVEEPEALSGQREEVVACDLFLDERRVVRDVGPLEVPQVPTVVGDQLALAARGGERGAHADEPGTQVAQALLERRGHGRHRRLAARTPPGEAGGTLHRRRASRDRRSRQRVRPRM
jgi:hypothetical protein